MSAEEVKKVLERYEKTDENEHKATMRVMKVITKSQRGRELVERLIEFDIKYGFCDYPKSCVVEYWGSNFGCVFEVKNDPCYYDSTTVFLKGKKQKYEETPFYHRFVETEDIIEMENALNELTEIYGKIEEAERTGK